MSGWHREHPDLIGTDADPWMMHESYRWALQGPPAGFPGVAAMEEMRDSAVCSGCGHRYDEHDPDPPGGGHCDVAGCDCGGHGDDHDFVRRTS